MENFMLVNFYFQTFENSLPLVWLLYTAVLIEGCAYLLDVS